MITVESSDGELRISATRPGDIVVGIPSEEAREFNRLAVFRKDLELTRQWLGLAKSASDSRTPEGQISQALSIAAIITFCTCFESTGAIRRQPLNPARIYDPTDRAWLKRLKYVRDKMVAHDEGLFEIHNAVYAISPEATAVGAYALSGLIPLLQLAEFGELPRLADLASSWTADAMDREAERLVERFNQFDAAERTTAFEVPQPYRVKFVAREPATTAAPPGGSRVEESLSAKPDLLSKTPAK